MTFARALLNQCRAVVLAMRAIRAVRPDAAAGADRGPGQDAQHAGAALPGRLRERAPLADVRPALRPGRSRPPDVGATCAGSGVAEADIGLVPRQPLPAGRDRHQPLRHQRALPRRAARTATRRTLHGGNGRHAYADVEAVRVGRAGRAGRRSCARRGSATGLPLAVTEAHLGCTREEQMRWLAGGLATPRGGAAARGPTCGP